MVPAASSGDVVQYKEFITLVRAVQHLRGAQRHALHQALGRKHTSLMIVVHVLGLLYGFGVMARHLVGNIMSLEAYSARWERASSS